LEDLGYTPKTVLYHLRLFAKFDLWLSRRRQRLRRLNEKDADRFLKRLHARHPAVRRGSRSVLRLALKLLRDVGVVAPKREPIASSPAQRLANEYRVFLKEERGLDRSTIYHYSSHIDRFLEEHFGAGRVNLRALGAREITAFVRRQAPRYGRAAAAQMVTGLRSFFRFAQFRGLVASDLAAVVPPVANWAMAGLPKYLSTEAVKRVLGTWERTTVRGKRDYAILLLLARLGLRAGEIVVMQLDDIDWANAELAIRSKKGDGWARLPLMVDVGQALVRYLAVRPPSAYRNVFVRDYAPWQQGVLTIGRAKFQKSRLVPLHESTLRQLRDYKKRRDRFFVQQPWRRPVNRIFVATHGGPLTGHRVGRDFRSLTRRIGRLISRHVPAAFGVRTGAYASPGIATGA